MARECDHSFQSILRSDLHVILCPFVDQRMHVIIHSLVLFKIHLNEIGMNIILRAINRI